MAAPPTIGSSWAKVVEAEPASATANNRARSFFMVLISFRGECVEAVRLGAADSLAAALWERASWWMYAGPGEIGLRKTEKILRGVQCRSKQVAGQWLQAPGTSGIRAKGAASGNEGLRTDVQSIATLHRVFTIWTERGPVTATMQPAADSALIDRMRTGDEAALSILYDRYSAVLFGMLVRILRDQQAAEEVLQDLFLQLWRNAGQFDAARGSLPAWLMVIGRNRAISRLRGRRDRSRAVAGRAKAGRGASLF